MFVSRMIFASAAMIATGACAQVDKPTNGKPGEPTSAAAGVTVAADREGGFKFSYAGRYVDEEGNFDFSEGEVSKGPVMIRFSLVDAPAGLTFKREGADAVWIVEKKEVGEESPKGPYQGEQFSRFQTSKNGRVLTIYNKNDDGVTYRYGLRFSLAGKTIMHDPDVKNGGGGHR